MPRLITTCCATSSLLSPRTVAVLGALIGLTFTGCMTGFREYVHNGFKVGPNYLAPEAPIADQWIDFADGRVRSEPDVPQLWWRTFNDPKLDELVFMAHNQNLSLREAGFRIAESQALRQVAVGNLLPQQQVGYGSYSRNMLSLGTAITAGGGAGFPGISRYFSIWNLGTQFAWELDFWGRYRRAIEEADAQLDVSIENFDNVLNLLVSEVAAAYIEIRTLEQRVAYAEANIVSQTRSLDLAKIQLQGGIATKLDVTQAATNLGQTESLVPDLQRLLRQAQNRLCVLLGIPPQNIEALLAGPKGIPHAPLEVVLGIPGDLLRRRADVRRAEREVAAQSARIGIAESNLYPAFTINGNIFVRADQFASMFNSQAAGGNVGPSFNWNILNYGRIRNAVAAEEARFMQEVAQYQTVVLTANREAEDAIVAFLRAQEQAAALKRASDAALESRNLVEELYLGGTTDFGRVFVAELVLTQQQDALAVAEGTIATSLVSIYRALGGGWQLRFAIDEGAQPMSEEIPLPQAPVPDAPPPPGQIPPAPQPPANE